MRSLLGALGLFTVVPVGARGELTRSDAVAALRWFPAMGAALGALAALPLAAVLEWTSRAALLGAAMVIALLALLTRGLHLDGLADTVDGLGSQAPVEQALEVMRRSDVGPFGVVAVVLVVLVDVAALAVLDGGVWRPVAALGVAAATGRLAVLQAAHQRVASARAIGFGAYIAGSMSTVVVVAETVVVLGFGVGAAAAVDASLIGWPVAQIAALSVCAAFRMHASRRLGGVTGDVFGALVEVGTALTLAGLALS
jgi:adenosylcobinamide-GDP ribazoletransferase